MNVERITPREVQEMLNLREQIRFLDARNPRDWGASDKTIPGSIRARGEEQEKKVLSEIPKQQTVVAYCT